MRALSFIAKNAQIVTNNARINLARIVYNIYTTSFGWCCAFPMQQKGEAHESLSLLFQRDGVPPSMIVDV